MLLYFLDDVFLLHLALKTPQRVFQRLILLNDYFGHCMPSPQFRFKLTLQSLAVAGFAHFNYRMLGRARSLPRDRMPYFFTLFEAPAVVMR